MSKNKKWSSFKEQQRLTESFRKWAEEEPVDIDEGFFSKEPDWEAEADRINTDADAECEELAGAFEKALNLNPYRSEERNIMATLRTNFSRKCSNNYNNICDVLQGAWKDSMGKPRAVMKRARLRFESGCPERADKFEKDNAELVKKLRHQGRDLPTRHSLDPETGRPYGPYGPTRDE